MSRILALVLPVCLGVGVLAAQKKPVTLETVTRGGAAVTPPATVIWAPDGKRFLSQRGAKVYLYDAATRSEKELFGTEEMEKAAVSSPPAEPLDWQNRRVREQRLQWAASGDALLVALKGDVFLYQLGSGRWEQLTSTREFERDPKLSPDGRRVSFRLDRDLYALEIATRKLTRLTRDGSATRWNAQLDWVYPEELDIATAHWWSPDSASIAYLQFDVAGEMIYPHADLLKLRPVAEPQRYPQAGTPNAVVRLGVLWARGGKTRWLDWAAADDDLIPRVDWMPDSKAVVAQRLNRVQNRLDLLALDIAGGKPRALVQEKDPAWVNITDDLRFLVKSPRFLWSSEQDGFRHLYLHSLNGGDPVRLTKGEWEVSEVACLDETAGRVYFTSTEQSPLERHLYSVGFDGGERRRLTTQPGSHQVSISPTCDFYLDTSSSLTRPSRRTLHSRDGVELAVLREADRRPLDEYEILPTEIVQVRAQDGALLYARLIRPAGFRPEKKYPAIVMVYGGPHAQSVRNSWRGADWDQALAHRGFVIWQLDNRGSAGRGHAWEATLYRRFGARELADQLEGLGHLIAKGFVDPERIGLYGWSYGGYMTLYSLLNAPDTFRAGVAGAPVTDWRNYDTIYTERYLGLPSQNEEGYQLSSPVHQAARLKGRLMLVHNFEDDNVLFQNTLRMADALEKAGKQFDLLVYPFKSHGVTGGLRRHLLEAVTGFFERHLKP